MGNGLNCNDYLFRLGESAGGRPRAFFVQRRDKPVFSSFIGQIHRSKTRHNHDYHCSGCLGVLIESFTVAPVSESGQQAGHSRSCLSPKVLLVVDCTRC